MRKERLEGKKRRKPLLNFFLGPSLVIHDDMLSDGYIYPNRGSYFHFHAYLVRIIFYATSSAY
jgi:hypothetical protein